MNKDAFLLELHELMTKYNISISHEDWNGAFILERYKESNWRRLLDADFDPTTEEQEIEKRRQQEQWDEERAAEQRSRGLIA